RLLPAVTVMIALVLVLHTAGLVEDATAQISQPSSAKHAAVAPKTQPAKADPAAGDGETGSAAQVDVLTNLSKRRNELDARDSQLSMRENLIAAAEKRVDAKIDALKNLQVQIQKLLGQRDAEQDKQLASLVKTYSAMKPKDAAHIFNALSDN